MDFSFQLLRQNRRNLLNLLDQFTLEEANRIPDGYRNNVIWNAGHILAGHQYLLYDFFNHPMQVPLDYVVQFRHDTFPSGNTSAEEFDQLKHYLEETVEQTIKDYQNGFFESGEYNPYTSDYFHVSLKTIEDGIHFNNYHEGIHVGYILALRRALKGVEV